MSNAVATVAFLQGQAWAKAPDGSLRPLTVGAVLNDNEIIVTAEGARVELDIGGVEPLIIYGGQEVAMSRDMNPQTATSADEALLDDASVDQALTILEQEGDLLEELEETAAGDNAGGGSDGSSNFVRLDRIAESTEDQDFSYNSSPEAQAGQAASDGDYVNRAPELADQVFGTDEDTPLTGQIIATDIEGDLLTYALAGGPANGSLQLNPATGQFVFTPNANYNGPDSFVVTVTDSRGNSSTATITLNVTPVNDIPVSADQNLVTDEDTPVSGQIVASDVENDTLSYSLTGAPANGQLVLDPVTGGFTYTPNANFNGSDLFIVTISDGNGGSTTSTVTIGVLPVNDLPVSSDQNLITPEDTPIDGQVVASDVDGDSLNYLVSAPAASGTVSLDPTTGAFTYTPNANFNGSDFFIVTISDGNGGTTTSRINIGVTPVNDAPVSSDQNLTTPEDTPIDGQVVAGDVDGDSLSYLVSAPAASGTVTLDPATGAFTYTPNANFNGSDFFIVTISDGNGGTTTSRINIGVTPVNDAPVSSDQNLTTPEDTPISGQVSASDVDGDSLSYVVSGQPANGSVTLNAATGTFTYTPAANYNGSDSFVVTISDGNGGTTTSRINIGVTPVNDAPVASNLNLVTPENIPVNGQISASDIDGDSLGYSLNSAPVNGTVVLNPATGSFTYTPNTGYNGSDSFTVTISDGNGGTTTSLVSIGVTPVNVAPTAGDLNLTTDEDVPVNGAISANDPDGDTLSYSVTGSPASGTVVLNAATGTFTYTPNTGYTGGDSFVVTISDGNGGTTTSTVTIGVNSTNDAPVASNLNLTTDEDIPVNGAVLASDPDSDPLSFLVSANPTHGSVILNPVTGTFTYTPNTNYHGSDSFVVSISDGKGGVTTSTVTIDVNPINDAPVTADQNLTTNENQAIPGTVSGSDPDGDSLRFLLQTPPGSGSLSLDILTGQFIYNPGAGFTGTDSFVVRVTDGNGGNALSTITIGVLPVNGTPDAVDDAVSVRQDTSVTVAVKANDTDPENDSLTVTGVTQGVHGSVVIDAVTGNPIYTPDAGYVGTDTFTYTISDGNGGTDTASVTVTVTANTAPVAVADSITLFEGGVATSLNGGATSLLANDTDAEGNPLTAILVTGPAHGTLTLNADGTFSYIHDGSETTVDSFTYKVNDGTVDGNTVTVNINITPVNERPIAVDDFYTTAEDTPIVFDLADWLLNDSDPDGDTISVFSASAVVNGTLSYVGGQLTFIPNAEYSGPASFNYSIHDGHGNTATATVHINVTNVDDPSVLLADVVNASEDTEASGNVLSNDTDVDSPLQVVAFVMNGTGYSAGDLVSVPGIGSLTLQASGAFTFTPVANYNGPVPQITYTTNTGFSSTLDITIDPVNDAPVANNDSLATTQNVALEINLASLTANDTDIDGHTLTVFAAGAVTNGSLAYIDGKLHFIPANNYTGPASFTYSITDGHGGTSSATVNISVTAAPNVAPETNSVAASGNEDTLITINLTGSDSDGTVAGYVIKSLPVNGVLYSDATMTTAIGVGDLVTGPVYFMPNANWNGSTQFDYVARDNLGLEDATAATASITVNPVADAAVLGTGAGSVKEDTPAQSSAGGTLSITDPDAGEASFQPQTNTAGTYGNFSINAAGVWTYNINNSLSAVQQLKEGETKTETFTVSSIDGATTSVVITVRGTNDAPTANADSATVAQGQVLTLTPLQLLANDTDPDGDTLSILSVQDPVNGSVSIVGGNAVFTPTAGYSGPASFTYSVSDGQGGTATATVNINVTAVNTPPDAINDNPVGNATATGLHAEYFGYRQGTDGLNLASLDQVKNFIATNSASATFTATTLNYNMGNGFNNNLGFGTNLQTFLGSDAASLSNDPATTSDAIIRMSGFVELAAGTYNFRVLSDDGYQIKIDGVTVAEVASNQSAATRIHPSFTLSISGLHTIEIVYWDQGYYAQFTAELSNDGGLSYQPFNAFNSYKTASLVAVEDTPFTISAATLLANDTDANSDTLSIVSVQGAVNGSVALVGGNVVFTPAANYAGPASFTYTITDGKGGFDTATVNLMVSPVNDAPVAANDNLIAASNQTLTIAPSTLVGNDVDVDGDVLQIIAVNNAVNGTVSINSSGNILFTPTSGYEGSASFTYTARDDGGITTTATVNLAVGSASAPSVVVSKSLVAVAQGTGGTSVKFPIITKLVDTDGSETLSIKVSGVPTGLSFNAGTNLGGGVWQFTAADLPNLMLNLPGSYTTNSTNLTVQVTATEANGGFTASTSTVVNLKAAYTTVDLTTTESGNYTGSSASENIQGGAGNNTINANNGNNIVRGGGGDDNLSAGSGTDIIYGGSGNDVINGGSGNDRLIGGAGNDTMSGGSSGENFVDVFAWSLGDQGTAGSPAVDTIQNFSTSAPGNNGTGGDVLDLRDLLQGESVGASNSAGNLADYLHFEISGSNTVIHISHTGGFNGDSHSVGSSFTSSATTQQIVLEGVNLQSLYSGATTDQQIITQMLNNNKLITD
ncbi:retention module-containing protein [Cellvibrio fontiphilus]|uniref:Retention module-containing protein n=1 Tax=Cellvibrio fontiphilus TaxID=1815559 RepID=A0ABV7FEP1_9GAMM